MNASINFLHRFLYIPMLCSIGFLSGIAVLPSSAYQASYEVANSHALSPQELDQTVEKANLLVRTGKLEEATKVWESIVAHSESFLEVDDPRRPLYLHNLAFVYAEQNLYNEAIHVYKNALAAQKKVSGFDHPVAAQIGHELGKTYFKQGQYDQAIALFEPTLALRMKVLGRDHPHTALTMSAVAWAYLYQGLLYKAELFFVQSLAITEKVFGHEHSNTMVSLVELGSFYHKQGLHGKAEKYYQLALSIAEKLGNSKKLSASKILNNLALLYQEQGLYSEAEAYYKRSLSYTEEILGPGHEDSGVTLNNLGSLYLLQGMYPEAEVLFGESLQLIEKKFGVDHPNMASILNKFAILSHKNKSYKAAEAFYLLSLDILAKSSGLKDPNASTGSTNLAGLYRRQGRYAEAYDTFRFALSEHLLKLKREAPFVNQLNRHAYLSANSHQIRQSFSWAFDGALGAELALMSRLNWQGLSADIEKQQTQLLRQPGEHQHFAQELRSLNQKLGSLILKNEDRKRIRDRQQELEKHLHHLLPQLRPRVVEVDAVAEALPKNAVLIEFQRYAPFDDLLPAVSAWGKEQYLAMILKPDGSITAVRLGDADVLNKAIADSISMTIESLSDAPMQFAKISQLLLEPLQQATAGATTWFVSPDSELNRLPFAALPMPGGGGYLSEAVDLNLITTGRELLDQQKVTSSAKTAALVVADPAYDRIRDHDKTAPNISNQFVSNVVRQRSSDMPDRLRWDPLPATAAEGEFVKAITGGQLLMQQRATAEAITRTPSPRLLHLASHAFYLPNQSEQPSEAFIQKGPQASGQGLVRIRDLRVENPLIRSGIALAGANQPNANPNDDGYLTALEVAQLDWEGTELVVISACESGLGDLQVGEGVYGLKRSIAVAGARSSLLTLWKVDDDATRLFMESFYKRLKQGEGKASALAATQKEFRESPELTAYSHPYYWAAFQLSGDGGPVEGL